jgi:hypothetical protein
MFGKALIAGLALVAAGMAQATDLALEPCVNGGVSRSGTWPSEFMEGAANAQLNWQSYEPYYLFAVSARYMKSPLDDDPDTTDTR